VPARHQGEPLQGQLAAAFKRAGPRRRRAAIDVSQSPAGAATRRAGPLLHRPADAAVEASLSRSPAGAAAKRAGAGRRRRDPVALEHHLTSPTSRETRARARGTCHWREAVNGAQDSWKRSCA
jgi:hypothetical protein